MSVQRIDRRENKWTKDSTFGCNCYEHMFPPRSSQPGGVTHVSQPALSIWLQFQEDPRYWPPIRIEPDWMEREQLFNFWHGFMWHNVLQIILDGFLNLFWFMQLGLTFKIPLPNLRSLHILRIPEVSIRSLVVTPCIPKTAVAHVAHVFSLFRMLQL